jgi:hypothetical protein
MNLHTPKWTPIVGVGLPNGLPNLQSAICRGQNPSIGRLIYIIRKLLKPRCVKWARISHLDIWSISYDQKKNRESNWQFDSWPLKIRNRPDFFTCKRRATYHWKALDLITIGGLHMMLWAPKVARIQVVRISRFPLGSLETKSHLDVAPMKKCRIYYKGEGGGFPQIRAVVSFVSLNCPWLVLAPKVFQLCINCLVLVFCRSVWVVETCQFFLVPSRSSRTPLYPSKMLRTRECASTPCSFVIFCLGFTFGVPQGVKSTSVYFFHIKSFF